jgi:hypothetical protein
MPPKENGPQRERWNKATVLILLKTERRTMKKIFCTLIILFLSVPGCKKIGQKSQGITESKIKPVDFLSSSKYKSLMIDFLYDQGYPPSTETVNNIKSFLSARLNKPSGIQVILREVSGNGKTALSVAEIQAIEKKNRSYFSDGAILSAFVYLAHSDYSENAGSNKVLGVHYDVTSIALFGKTLREFSGGLTKPSYANIETTVLEHEFGHVLGLVDHGTPMSSPHIDSGHGQHCNNSGCLMYYLAETSDIVANLLGGVIPALDNNCLNDLKNNGGK